MQNYIEGNPYDLGRLVKKMLSEAASDCWSEFDTGWHILEAMAVRSSIMLPLNLIKMRQLRVAHTNERFYLTPVDANAETVVLLDTHLQAAVSWGERNFSSPLPQILVFVKDDFAAPTYVSFDTPSIGLIQIPRHLLEQENLSRLLWHEIGHCFLRCGIRFLDEGLATWVELHRKDGRFDSASAQSLVDQAPQRESYTLAEFLSTGFTNSLGFEDKVTNESEREALYPRSALAIDDIVRRVGIDGLASLFQSIREQPENALQYLRDAMGKHYSSLEQVVASQSQQASTPPIELAGYRAEIMRARAKCEPATLADITNELVSQTQTIHDQMVLLDAYISARELSCKFDDHINRHIEKIAAMAAARAKDVLTLETAARFTLIKLIDAKSFIDRATLAAKANRIVDEVLAIQPEAADALLTRAHLLIHTPIQYGGDPDRGSSILLKLAKRTDEYREIAVAIYQKNFGDSPLLTLRAEGEHDSPLSTELNRDNSQSSLPQIAEDAAVLFHLRGLSFEKGADFSIEIPEMQIRSGEVFGLIGSNGAGKSLLLECCLGLNQFQVMSHQIFDQDFKKWHRVLANRSSIGVKLHRLKFDNSYRVADIVTLARTCFGDDGEIYQLFSIDTLLSKKYGWLSTGQRQRVDLYFAFHQGASLFFLDEPTLGLDDEYRARLFSLLENRVKQGAGIVVVSHDQQVLSLCHRIAVMSKGRICANGSAIELRQQYLSEFHVEINQCRDVDSIEVLIKEMAPRVTIKRADSIIAMGDTHFLERFQSSASNRHIENYHIRRSELSDLYSVAGNFTSTQEVAHEA